MSLPPDSYNPAALVERFVQEAGIGLATVTELVLCLEDTCESDVPTSVLNQAVATLVQACPALKTLWSDEYLSLPLFALLGAACPQLSEFTVCEKDDDIPLSCVHAMIKRQPSLFPHLETLAFPWFCGKNLPDFSCNNSIHTLLISSFTFSCEAHWRRLPPMLQRLHIGQMIEGPSSVMDGTSRGNPLSSMRHLRVEDKAIPLHAVARLLQEAPALQELQVGCENDIDNDEESHLVVQCSKSLTTASDLSILQERVGLGSITTAIYHFDCGPGVESTSSLQPFIATLPCMTGVGSCIFSLCDTAEFMQLLKTFPDVRDLVLGHMSITDMRLQSLASCSKLQRLKLYECDNITPYGLLALCFRLPGLCHVRCEDCDQLYEPHLYRCQQPLLRDIVIVDRDASKGVLCGDWS